jgi:hypothetical protein
MLSISASLNSISISDSDYRYLDDGSHNIIKERLEIIRVRLGRYEVEFSKLAECIADSKVLKKVILEGLTPIDATAARANRITELKRLVEACEKRKTVELWKENFIVNGKVDLNGDVVGFLITTDPSIRPDRFLRCCRQPRLIWHELA